MTDRQLHLLSPYRPPTSYAVSLQSDEVAAWLNGHAALWHPAVLQGAARPPQLSSVYDHDQPVEHAVYAIPEGPHIYQPDDWQERLREVHGVAFTATANRAETYARLQESLNHAGQGGEYASLPVDVLRLFAGIGYGYLVLETLCEAMSHDRLLDPEAFWNEMQAAVAACKGELNHDQVLSHLRSAAQQIQQAREGMQGNTIYLMNWWFPRPDGSDSDSMVREMLRPGLPAIWLGTAKHLQDLARQDPEQFAQVKQRVASDGDDAIDICTGVVVERDDALLAVESQLWTLNEARRTREELLGDGGAIFARWRSAGHPQLPSWLVHAGYRHAVATNFDGALNPSRYAALINWPAPDGRAVDAFTKEPHKVSETQTFFNLAYLLYQASTHDAAPTLVFLHRDVQAGTGYDDLMALSELAPALGQWTSLTRYFADAYTGEYTGAASGDDFFADYLDDRVTERHRPDPVSGFAHHYRLRRKLDGTYALAALLQSLSKSTVTSQPEFQQLQALENAIELRGPDQGPADVQDDYLLEADKLESHWAQQLADRLQARSPDNTPGVLVLNPCAYPRRVALELPNLRGPIPVEGVVKASEFADGLARVVVEVPGMGYSWFPRSPQNAEVRQRLKTAEGTVVRNEFFEADLDPVTGGLRGFRDTRTRQNRLGCVLVFNPGSKMKASRVEVTNAGAALGEVTSIGQITDEHDNTLADFRLRIRAWIGRPALELRVEITPTHKPNGYPWHAYYGARFAWRDERAAMFRSVNGTNSQSTYPRPVSPDYIEFRLASQRSFLFTGGLPFVQRHGKRMLDVVLIPEGETATSFDMVLALDRENPMQTATGWIAPTPYVLTDKGPPPSGASSWLAHLDLPSLSLTRLQPVAPQEGCHGTVLARFLETAGYGGAAEFQWARDPNRAWSADLAGKPAHELSFYEGRVPVEFSAGELNTLLMGWGEVTPGAG